MISNKLRKILLPVFLALAVSTGSVTTSLATSPESPVFGAVLENHEGYEAGLETTDQTQSIESTENGAADTEQENQSQEPEFIQGSEDPVNSTEAQGDNQGLTENNVENGDVAAENNGENGDVAAENNGENGDVAAENNGENSDEAAENNGENGDEAAENNGDTENQIGQENPSDASSSTAVTSTKVFAVKTGNDDAYANASRVSLTNPLLYLNGMNGSTAYDSYLRFADVSLPADAIVKNAYLEFTVYRDTTTSSEITVSGELGSGEAFSTVPASFTNRTYTNPSAPMNTPNALKNSLYRTENIADIVNQMRTQNPQLLNYVFKISGNNTGLFRVRTYNNGVAYAPKLVIEYASELGEHRSSITNRNDDAEEYLANNTMSMDGTMQIGGFHSTSLTASNKQVSAFRFENVILPDNAEIVDAYMQFTTLATSKNRESNQEIRVELGDAATYSSAKGDISKRKYGVIGIKYKQSSLTTAKQTLRTPNLRDIIDENRLNGWQSGQALAFVISGDNYIGSVYQGGSAYPPQLIIEYKFSSNGNLIGGAIQDPNEIRNVFINEISAEGSKSSKESWVEFYNANEYPVILSQGIKIWRDNNKKDHHEFQNFLIPAKSFRVMYFDENTAAGNDHAGFELKSSAELILTATDENGAETVIHSLKYSKHDYNQSYGLKDDGGNETILFTSDSLGRSNQSGQEKYGLILSHDRGIYPNGFNLTIDTKPGATIKYTLNGSTPSESNGQIYSGSIAISQSCAVRIYAYDESGNSAVNTYTYVLLDNFKNEKSKAVTGGTTWRYRSTIGDAEYAQALQELPIISVTADVEKLKSNADYIQGSFEYIDVHVNENGTNYISGVGVKKFGQASITQYNSNVALRFKRDYGNKKAKYAFFEPIENDAFPPTGKFGRLDLKEGQDGPQANIYNLGYLRYDEKAVNTLAKNMQMVSLNSRYVHYYFNGNYMGVKTLRERFNDNYAENMFGGENDEYTRIRFQDGSFTTGTVESGDGDVNLMKTVLSLASSKQLQGLKNYVDIEDMIKTQILFMFIDTEREIDALIHNEAATGGGIKMVFNINDTDGAFYNDGKTGTSSSGFAGGGGTYRHKWGESTSRRGAGRMFGYFSGDSITASAGNLEFKTLVKDQVLAMIGPASGDFRGAAGAPLSVDNVKKVLYDNQQELATVYKLDSAFMSTYSDMYQRWQNANQNVLNQVDDRVKFSLEMWLKYNMAHTLNAVEIIQGEEGLSLINPNNQTTTVYYTIDGTDPMGADGVVSASANVYMPGTVIPTGTNIIVRAFAPNNWGPMSKA